MELAADVSDSTQYMVQSVTRQYNNSAADAGSAEGTERIEIEDWKAQAWLPGKCRLLSTNQSNWW